MNYTQEALGKYIEQNAELTELDPYDLAGLYLWYFPTPTLGMLAENEIKKWAEQADQNHYTYQESLEAFSEYIYTEVTEEETGETISEISSCVNWLKVWADILQADWYAYQVTKDRWLFVARWI